ncbi:ABC transporter permease subunit [Actinoplanes sp. HUAS TT8]|uniref:ABC transporter permease subunit n=1 Tax=Actinoplanes sp. HUAS TT8 TaxID=3447453 RepID=UPI003F51FB66
MIWLTWRQLRVQAIAGAALIVLLLALILISWRQVTDLASSSGYTGCSGDACAAAAKTFLSQVRDGLPQGAYTFGLAGLFLLPAIVGAFWGAPMVARELESGTYRMIFSQSVSRGRWLLVKLALGAAAVVVGVGVLSLILTRWAGPIDTAGGDRITPLVFPGRGVVPIGYAVAGFVIGVTLGLVLRRTLVAMAVTLLVVVGLQVAAPLVYRPWLAQPTDTVTALDVEDLDGIGMNPETGKMHLQVHPVVPGAWVLKNIVLGADGNPFIGPADLTKCGQKAGFDECQAWIKTQNLRVRMSYVPGSKFWTLQWREFGATLVLAGALSLFSLWWIRRRLV